MKTLTERFNSQKMSKEEFVSYATAKMIKLEGNAGHTEEVGKFTYVFSWRSVRNTYGHPAITFEYQN